MDKHITMWVKWHCPFCVKAKDLLYDQKVSHTIHIMDDRLKELDEIKEKWDFSTVPIIVVQDDKNDILIGGYTDLVKWFDEDSDD